MAPTRIPIFTRPGKGYEPQLLGFEYTTPRTTENIQTTRYQVEVGDEDQLLFTLSQLENDIDNRLIPGDTPIPLRPDRPPCPGLIPGVARVHTPLKRARIIIDLTIKDEEELPNQVPVHCRECLASKMSDCLCIKIVDLTK